MDVRVQACAGQQTVLRACHEACQSRKLEESGLHRDFAPILVKVPLSPSTPCTSRGQEKRPHHTFATIRGSKGRALPSTHSEQLLGLGCKSDSVFRTHHAIKLR